MAAIDEVTDVAMRNRLRTKCLWAIGWRCKVRTDAWTQYTGHVISASFRGWRQRGRSRVAQFNIRLRGPEPRKAEWDFVVEQLPRDMGCVLQAVAPADSVTASG
jgi:hypothetical protein